VRPVKGTFLYSAALAIALGMAAQTVAVRFALPSIVLLLGIGVAIGPDVLSLLDPAVFGSARTDLVALAVTIILFEGGLALRIEDLRRQQRSLTLLLTLGSVISMAGGTLAAHFLLGMPWNTAILYGSLMIVTGPTVVTPLLSRLAVERPVRDLLISEGVLNDPIGAIIAIVALEYALGHHGMWETGSVIAGRLLVGAAVGASVGLAVAALLRRRWVDDDLWNPVVLASVLLAAAFASRVSAESGLMTAVTQGVVMANTGIRELRRLQRFNEEITIVLLSFIFILLAAALPLSEVHALGWPAVGVVAVLAWVARPLAVFACTAGSDLSIGQRAFVSWVCPRGIVAASVASLFGILLTQAEIPGGSQLEALVFVTVALTVTVQGLTIGPVARLLGVDLPSMSGTIIVGAHPFARMLARVLLTCGRQVALIDRNRAYCRAAANEGLAVYTGDALSVDALEEAGARYVDAMLAVTSNNELNALVAERVRDNFHLERILAVADEPSLAAHHLEFQVFPGNFTNPDDVNRAIRQGHLRLVEYSIGEGDLVGSTLDTLPYASDEFAMFLSTRDRTYFASSDQTLSTGDRLLCASLAQEESPLSSIFTRVRSLEPKQISELAEDPLAGSGSVKGSDLPDEV
jgi:NhaP-type Na+/H+ or K+/H+ antiporter